MKMKRLMGALTATVMVLAAPAASFADDLKQIVFAYGSAIPSTGSAPYSSLLMEAGLDQRLAASACRSSS